MFANQHFFFQSYGDVVVTLTAFIPTFYCSTRLPGIPTRQELVDVLLKVMVHEEQHTFSVRTH